MPSLYQSLLLVHGAAGVVSLIAFWAAAVAQKGSPRHRSVGKAYLLGMIGVVASALPMAAIIASTGRFGAATFLGYLVVITATSVWLGWRAIRRKQDQSSFRDGAYLSVALLNLAASLASFAMGVVMSQPLLMGFSIVGLVGGIQMMIRRARPQDTSRWWLREHYAAMLGGGVAIHVAFLAIGAPRLLRMIGVEASGNAVLIFWFLPVVVGLIVGVLLDRKYMPKRDTGTMAAPARSMLH